MGRVLHNYIRDWKRGIDVAEKIKQIMRAKLFWVVFLLLVLSLLLHFFVGSMIVVQGESMETTLEDGAIVLIEKVSYRSKEPRRNDIVVVTSASKEQYIKRIIGLPGETVRIRKGNVFIDGKKMQECMEFEEIVDGGMAREKIVLGEDEYFLLGDNRNHSKDSRNPELGIVNQSQFDGKVFWQIYPFDKMGAVD